MPFGINAFGCVAITESSGLVVGGAYFPDDNVTSDVFLFTRESQTLARIGRMEQPTRGKECAKAKLSTGKSVVLCTLGIIEGLWEETGETYVYDISARKFERMAEWDFPNDLIGLEATRAHVIGEDMLLQTADGTFLFRDDETSPDTSSHWFKVGDWAAGFSAPFNLRFVIP